MHSLSWWCKSPGLVNGSRHDFGRLPVFQKHCGICAAKHNPVRDGRVCTTSKKAEISQFGSWRRRAGAASMAGNDRDLSLSYQRAGARCGMHERPAQCGSRFGCSKPQTLCCSRNQCATVIYNLQQIHPSSFAPGCVVLCL